MNRPLGVHKLATDAVHLLLVDDHPRERLLLAAMAVEERRVVERSVELGDGELVLVSSLRLQVSHHCLDLHVSNRGVSVELVGSRNEAGPRPKRTEAEGGEEGVLEVARELRRRQVAGNKQDSVEYC